MKRSSKRAITSVLTAAALMAATFQAYPVAAQNFLFISEIRLETGEGAYEALEAEGYSVMSIGLNAAAADGSQVYLGYKTNTGAPITNILLSPDVGDSFDTNEQIHYECASHTDVDAGAGATGCLYVTHDTAAGAPLVGLDILRANSSSGETLPAIPNDGAEIVRSTDGAPADLEAYSDDDTIYLAQIRDGIVCPYISEIMPVTAADQQAAIHTAAVWGYNYYIAGDIDTAADTYTILACKRTADPAQAITNISAISADVIRQLEAAQALDPSAVETTAPSDTTEPASEAAPTEAPSEPDAASAPEAEEASAPPEETPAAPEETEAPASETAESTAPETEEATTLPEETAAVTEETEAPSTETSSTSAETAPAETPLTGNAVGISGISYRRASCEEIPGDQPYHLYTTKDAKAGNPVSMLYVGEMTESSDIMFGTWLSGFFGTKGATSAYGYSVNEDLYASHERDTTLYTRVPVRLLTAADLTGSGEQETTSAEAASEAAAVPEEGSAVLPTDAQTPDQRTLPLSFLTEKEGLSESRLLLGGLRTPVYETPVVEQYEVYEDTAHAQASAFQKRGVMAMVIGGAAAVIAAVGAVIRKKHRPDQADRDNSGKTG